jgi:hypothetical protein
VSRRLWIGLAAAALSLGFAAPAGAAGITLTVKAVPQLQGLDFSFGGHTYTTGKDGTVAIPVGAPGTYSLKALPWRHVDRGLRVSFSRWGDESFTAARTLKVRGSKTVEAGYGVSYLRGLAFYDCVGAENTDGSERTGCDDNKTRRVKAERVTTVTLASSIGETKTFHEGQRRWLVGARVSRRLNGLEETIITYSVMHARVSGSDVVNQAQQRFYFAKTATPPRGQLKYAPKNLLIRLSLYDAHFTTHDLLLRTSVGKALHVTYPDGRQRDVPFHNGEVTLRSMARGLYHVKVMTNAGLQMTVPVSLSKNQDMQLKVISYADIGGSFVIFALVALLLVTARRPSLRAAIRRRLSSLGRNHRRMEAQP